MAATTISTMTDLEAFECLIDRFGITRPLFVRFDDKDGATTFTLAPSHDGDNEAKIAGVPWTSADVVFGKDGRFHQVVMYGD